MAYKELNQPLAAYDHFIKSFEHFENKEYVFDDCSQSMRNKMSTHIKEFEDLNELRQIILSKSKKCKHARKRNNNFTVNPGKIENLKAACKALVRADRYNGSLLRGIVASEIQNDESETIRVYNAMIERVPYNMKAYFQFYSYLRRINNTSKIDSTTIKMMKAIEDPSVSTDEWMEAHITRAHALASLNRPDEAIEVLENLIHIIPPLPIPGLSYLKKLENKRISPEQEVEHSNGAITIGYESNSVKQQEVQDFIERK